MQGGSGGRGINKASKVGRELFHSGFSRGQLTKKTPCIAVPTGKAACIFRSLGLGGGGCFLSQSCRAVFSKDLSPRLGFFFGSGFVVCCLSVL